LKVSGKPGAVQISFTTCSASAFIVTSFFIIFNANWGKAERQTLRYAITLNSSMGVDGGHFVIIKSCYSYSPHLIDNSERIANLLVGLTCARMTWGFGLCFLKLRVKGYS
jgi:hypothetical protein